MNNELPMQLDHPAAWRGEELFDRDDWMYQLLPQEQQAIARHGTLPESLIERFKFIQDALENGSGVSLVRGVPLQSFSAEGMVEFFQSIAKHIGTPISQSADGETIFSVRNSGFADNDPRARGPNTNKKPQLSYGSL